jgi:hypothetical protein
MKFSLYLTKYCNVKRYWGSGFLAPWINIPLDGGEWASHHGHFTPRVKPAVLIGQEDG